MNPKYIHRVSLQKKDHSDPADWTRYIFEQSPWWRVHHVSGVKNQKDGRKQLPIWLAIFIKVFFASCLFDEQGDKLYNAFNVVVLVALAANELIIQKFRLYLGCIYVDSTCFDQRIFAYTEDFTQDVCFILFSCKISSVLHDHS